jgi:hypothetical protein
MAISVSGKPTVLCRRSSVFFLLSSVRPQSEAGLLAKHGRVGTNQRDVRSGEEHRGHTEKESFLIWDLFSSSDFVFTFGHFFQGFFT